jgi:hypothetical protein
MSVFAKASNPPLPNWPASVAPAVDAVLLTDGWHTCTVGSFQVANDVFQFITTSTSPTGVETGSTVSGKVVDVKAVRVPAAS